MNDMVGNLARSREWIGICEQLLTSYDDKFFHRPFLHALNIPYA